MNSAIYVSLAISLGAIPGALSRYYLTLFFGRWFGIAFPYGTLFINLTGAFVMGFFATLISRLSVDPSLYLLVVVGFLGSYTTFSTYTLDTSNLLRTKHYKAALLYWFGSPILGFISVEIGIFLANMVS
ncbi:MAG: fluoride efflux transporter CrcB [Desmonostoc vinosum HA7617-LM4]|jgi:CrcB protein|nr:fluoride efflux transporter CrcB [Desmonostoc vinosum HA7617-LM4]